MNQVTVAISEETFRRLFATIRDHFHESTSGHSGGAFSFSWNIGVRLQNGSIDLQPDDSVRLSELDVVYDPLTLELGIDIPELCIGGFCIIPSPWGCILRAPKICIFSDNPDIRLALNLSGLLRSELSGAFSIKTRYRIDPSRTAGMTDLDAEDAGVPNKWRFHLDPIWLDIDLIDIPDTVGAILDAAINNAVDNLLFWLPGWARDLVKAILGSIVDLIRAILDIGDDIDEWLSNLLGVSIGLFDFVSTIVADYFANRYPVFEFEDPFPILGYEGIKIPVKIPVRNVSVTVNDAEMILDSDIGD